MLLGGRSSARAVLLNPAPAFALVPALAQRGVGAPLKDPCCCFWHLSFWSWIVKHSVEWDDGLSLGYVGKGAPHQPLEGRFGLVLGAVRTPGVSPEGSVQP